jgi:hypothetical protein
MVGMKNSRLSTAGSQLAELLVTVVTGEVDDDSKPEAPAAIRAALFYEIVKITVLNPAYKLPPFGVAVREDGSLGLLGIGDEDRLATRGYLDACAAVAAERGAPHRASLTTSISHDNVS